MKRLALLAGLCLMAGSWTAARADLVINGSFEAPTIPNPSYSTYPTIPGWTAPDPALGIEIQNHVAGSPYDGNQFVELDTSANSGMYQDLNTVAGQLYRLSFAYSPRPGVPDTSTGINVSWDGSLITNIAQSGVGNGDTVWQVFTYALTATSATTRLEFDATGTSDGVGGYIDAVSVTATPEPSTLVSFAAAGVVGIVARVRSLRRRPIRA